MARLAIGLGASTVGAGGILFGLSGIAAAAEPAPTFYWTVDPPTLGLSHSPNPVQGQTGTTTTISLEIATNNDFESPEAPPAGTVTFTDSQGIIRNCTKEPAQSYNLDVSYAYCTVTFPTGTTGTDTVTASYSGDKNDGAAQSTQTITFAPGTPTPEAPWSILLPITAAVIGAGTVLRSRRRPAAKSL